VLALVWIVSSCALLGDEKASADGLSGVDQGLLTAYVLLEETLAEESKLGALAFLKKVTFDRPVSEIDDLMRRLSRVSKQRLKELEALRRLPPDVSGGPASVDPIGEAITTNATSKGMGEMLAREGFGIRFILLQAQATRMVHAISTAAAERETHERRRKWLMDLGEEFEAFRDELVTILELYILQKGAAQQE
jgi:hypothetical protein